MKRFDLTERTVDRYIQTIREAGFIIPRPKNGDGMYQIHKASPYFKEISELLHFSKEEAHILYNAIHSISNENLLKQNLINKLYTLYNSKEIAQTIVKQQHSAVIQNLNKAIIEKRKVILYNYRSANSDKLQDRRVEPFSFTTNFISTWAYDINSGCCKTFKNTRISSVSVLNENWEHSKLHKEGFMDVFRISSNQRINVKLKLSLRACELLKEEYPLAEKDITPIDDTKFLLETEVCSFEGVGRFVMGLCQDIEIVEPTDLKIFIKKKIEDFLK
ncbi:Predicted DNA-binding transcriptional regulator YafY, contains an HTH and WYL domains [Alkalitalea saponilacus]|uniref:Predicted DNA-binding transcriptional regulator YafY, contains an HTH and WYL domains n=2 Tax=Alkalitalea saponilacus TaxID=889453 RepID=A0A1T5HUE9_9BACT|nr:Predicted DNA-binding transcriptional regulator YafY, contains an HTH and WYL domains [Alkalitalea saponilacus]